MCGIAGIYNYQSSKEPSTEGIVKNMLSLIKHRGPDESGILQDSNVGMGSVRLSIIDLTSGQQPMSDQSGRYWIVYNGEIFNYTELRSELITKGVRFKTTSDTEVVVQMYATYGADCLKYFNGQFAFCIWDRNKKELFLARDRVGIRPLFYWHQNNSFAFCSEIKGLLSLEHVERSLDEESLSQIFTYWTTLTPKTPFKGIFELQPGHYMHVSSRGIQINKYWSLDYTSTKEPIVKNLSDSIEELDNLLDDAVKIRLKADVPVGAYLSGGLDSSVTTSYIKKIEPNVLNTFSIGFSEKAYDESGYQSEAANFFNTNHIAFSCTSEELAGSFAQTIWHTEFPILRTSPIPMFLLSKKVRENNIKVVITGEGADEFFGGYNIFKETKIRRFWASQPNSKIRPKLLTKLYPYIPLVKDAPEISLKMFFGYKLSETENPAYSHLLRWNNTSRLKSFFSDDIISSQNSNSSPGALKALPDGFARWSGLAKAQYLEATIFMSGYLLSSQGDRMAMGNSVEGRYPFLDHRLIEFSSKLPDNFKLNCLNEKFILKKLSVGKIPASITNRSKQAYRAPVSTSLYNFKTPDHFNDFLSDESIISYGIFNLKKVKTFLAKLEQQDTISEIDQMALVGILSTQMLYKMFIKEPITPNSGELKNCRIINSLKSD
ncbi:asparagine synthase (glutamine-hydrolysing) [Tangfeifania diversioriginum]|uniref:asparagine synthase (glutamine-hydrolyzing) n=1 Tax=Tangfeifania diversioriginum TaxID=1168035 RepID=A0A1M6GT48_9BACT|nr:asparagine synthase (glutamine-hydrolyzing) [Tangfeifania diversioriginum]SHJ13097.1 asparagine synthase (glutamine-hydrolysing) [Tangfeifania diversioriginum]